MRARMMHVPGGERREREAIDRQQVASPSTSVSREGARWQESPTARDR